MINPNFSQRHANGAQDTFRILTIYLTNSQGDYCGEVRYVRMGDDQPDLLDQIIYETIKTKYPLSGIDSNVYDTAMDIKNFNQFKRHKRLFLACKNYTPWDPGYQAGQIDSGIAIHLDVYKTTRTYIDIECESFLRINDQNQMANACNEEYSNFATYREFFA